MDVEALIISYLSDLGYEVYADVPETRPSTFVTVERVGGNNDGVAISRPSVVLQSWAPTRYEASLLARSVDDGMRVLAEVDDRVIKVSLNGMYNYPDLESGNPRYQALYNLTTFL